MAQQLNVSVKINGKEITPFSRLTVEQSLWQHHAFTIVFNQDVIEAAGVYDMVQAKGFIGKTVIISFADLKKKELGDFKGLLTSVSLSNNLSASGDIIFTGFGSTIMLESNRNDASYLEQTLSSIVQKTTTNIDTNLLTIKCSPTSDKSKPLPYVVQHNESNFEFLRRLAAEYGQWFFYDGNSLHFGNKPSASKIALSFPHDVSDYDLKMSIQSVNFKEVSFLSKEGSDINESSGSQNVDGLDALGKYALDVASQTFKFQSKKLSERKFKEASELKDKLKIQKSALAAEMVVLRLNTDNPAIKIGSRISFSTKPLLDKPAHDMGEFFVTTLTHSTDGLGNYENLIFAIPSSITIPPNPYAQKPLAETQIGVVIGNDDPEKRGRVQVKLLWQENEEKTPWLRVMSHSGGALGSGDKNRGIFFTPEIDDHVLVGFTQNDPERPFVLGSLMTGKTSDSAHNSNNQTKTIRTRSGATVYFHDKEKSKEQEIRIETDKDNYLSILVNNGNGNIKLYSTKEIEVKSKESIKVNSGETIHVEAGKSITMKSEKINIEASDSIKIKANKKIDIESMDITAKANNAIALSGSAKASLEAAQVEVNGSATTKVSANATLDVQSSGITSVKGTLVKIN